MKFCKRCLQMNTRYALSIGDDGICDGCKYYDSMDRIDWNERKLQLWHIIEEAKCKAHNNTAPYDCIVGVSGGKDSTFIACYLKENFDVNILLVNCPPANMTREGEHNLKNLQSYGFDMIQYSFDPVVAKRLALYAFETYGHICMPYEQAMIASIMRTALAMKIPLAVMGENPALVWGTKHTLPNDDWLQVIENNTNKGAQEKSFWQIEDISPRKIQPYVFPDVAAIKQAGIRAIFLQYYTREYSPVYNADYAVARGLMGRYGNTTEEIGRYRIFSSIDDDLMIPNEMLKYYKNGFGRASDDAVVDLREGRLSREQAIKLIEKYDGKCSQKFIHSCCAYLEISEDYFWKVVDKFVNKKLFKKDESGRWVPKFKVGIDLKDA